MKKNSILHFFVSAWLLGCLGLSFALSAQGQGLKFKTLSSKDGLSSSMAWSLAQDQHGFIWMGTYDGLNVYNGYEFKTYRHEEGNPNSLRANFIPSLLFDQKQRLWVGSYLGLDLYDPERDHFTHFATSGNPEILPPNNLWIYEDRQHVIWTGTSDGMNFLNEAKGKFEKPAMLAHMGISMPVNALIQDRQGRYWVGTEKGLYVYTPKTQTYVVYYPNQKSPFSLAHDVVYALLEDSRGDIWVGTSRGLDLFIPEKNGFKNFRNHPDDSRSPLFTEVRSLEEGADGNLWIGTYDGGLKKMDVSSLTFSSYRRDPKDPYSLADNSVKKVMIDGTGGIWVASFRGVSYADHYQMQFDHLEHKTYDPTSLTDNFITTLLKDSKGTIWAGNRNGISRFNPQERGFTHYTHNPADPTSISDGAILNISEDAEGNFWSVTHTGLVDRFDQKTKRFHRFKHDPADPSSIKERANFVLSARNGNVWVSFLKGVSLYDKEQHAFTHFFLPDSINKGHIIFLFEDSQNNLWVVGREALYLFNRQQKTFSLASVIPQHLAPFQATHIYEDKHNTLWVGSAYKGLVSYNLKSQALKVYNAQTGLPDLYIKGILQDRQGNLWISASSGLSRFNPVTSRYKKYSLEDGLKNYEFHQEASIMAPDGKMWFGGHHGISVFCPDQILDNPNPPKVAITSFQLFNKEVPIGEQSPLKKPITETSRVNLDYRQSVVSFEFVGLNYNAPEKNQYAYRMLGFEEEWNHSGTRRHATYTNLPPGKTYTFQVKASNNDGIWNETGTSLEIYIKPPFWATCWFYGLLALFFGCSLYALFRWRTRQHYHQRRKLERKVKERTEEVEAQKEALTAHANQLNTANKEITRKNKKIIGQANKLKALDQLKSRFLANISHEVRTPLTLILVPLEEMLAAAQTDGDTKGQLSVMNRNARRLLELINQLLDLSKLENGTIPLEIANRDIVSFVKSVSLSFASLASKHQVDYQFSSTEREINASFDGDKVEKIMSNLISNAFKFTPEGGSIRISVQSVELTESGPADEKSTQRQYVEFTVSDTGSGISNQHLPHIFDRFYQGDASLVRKTDGTGIGLALTKELVELHGGRIKVQSQPGQGTCFTVLLPLLAHLPAAHDQPEEVPYQELDNQSPGENLKEPDRALSGSSPVALDFAGSHPQPMLLIVEDNPDLRQQIRRVFARDFQVEEAADGVEGWEKASQLMPDFIISDVMMPGKDGLDLCSQLKQDPHTSHIPTILLSARVDAEEAGLLVGADDYITKPFNAKTLVLKVKNLLETRQKFRQAICRELGIQPVSSSPKPASITPQDQHFLDQASSIALAHLTNPEFDLEVLYRELGMSRTLVYRKMKSLSGLGPNEFIRRIRLNKASQLILEGRQSIAEVMEEVGFNHRSYFVTCFRNEFGHLPSEHASLQEAQPA